MRPLAAPLALARLAVLVPVFAGGFPIPLAAVPGQSPPHDPLLPPPTTLRCTRSHYSIYSRFPIHWNLENHSVQVPFHGNRTCPLSGDPVHPDAYLEHEGQRVYFCCFECAQDCAGAPKVQLLTAYYPGPGVPRRLVHLTALDPVQPEQEPVDPDIQEASHGVVAELALLRDFSGGTDIVFQGWWITLADGTTSREFERAPILSLARADHPEATPLRNATCPVSGHAVRPDILAVHAGRILNFASWDSLATFVREPERWPVRDEGSER